MDQLEQDVYARQSILRTEHAQPEKLLPDSIHELLILRARNALSERRSRLAELLARQILRFNSESLDGMELLASAFSQLGRIQSAIEVRAQIRKRLKDPRNLLELGQLYGEIGSHEQELMYLELSIEACDEVIDTSQEWTQQLIRETEQCKFNALKAIGNLFVKKGDFDAADEYYHRAFRIDPQSDVLMVNRGTLEISRDRLDEAKELFRAALTLNGTNAKAWVGLALVHRSYGDHELSFGNLNKALDLEPGNRTAIRILVEWAVRDGAIRMACERLEKYLQVDPEDVEVAFSLSKLKVLLGELADAIFECERVLAFDPFNEEATRLRKVLAEKILEEQSL